MECVLSIPGLKASVEGSDKLEVEMMGQRHVFAQVEEIECSAEIAEQSLVGGVSDASSP